MSDDVSKEGEDQQVRCWLVQGLVQGVGFRVFVMREATKLRLRGMVRNTKDGAVDVVAVGPAAHLGQLEERLQIGPEMAEVQSLTLADFEGDAASFGSTFMIVG